MGNSDWIQNGSARTWGNFSRLLILIQYFTLKNNKKHTQTNLMLISRISLSIIQRNRMFIIPFGCSGNNVAVNSFGCANYCATKSRLTIISIAIQSVYILTIQAREIWFVCDTWKMWLCCLDLFFALVFARALLIMPSVSLTKISNKRLLCARWRIIVLVCLVNANIDCKIKLIDLFVLRKMLTIWIIIV